ncbi:unnamed protein product [Prunus brigantina]
MDEAHDMLHEGILKRDRVGKEKAWNLIWIVSSSNSRIDFGDLKGFLETEKGANILTKHSHNLRSNHQPLDQSIKCVPTAKKRRTHDQGGGRDLWWSHHHASRSQMPI